MVGRKLWEIREEREAGSLRGGSSGTVNLSDGGSWGNQCGSSEGPDRRARESDVWPHHWEKILGSWAVPVPQLCQEPVVTGGKKEEPTVHPENPR